MPRPKLVLAHAPDAVAQTACEAIRRQLHEVGIELELRAFGPGEPVGLSDDVDLVYVELAAWEPVVDAWPLLGENGMAGAVSPYLSLALRQLRQATDWRRVSARLREIHRIVYDEVAVVPLWQLTDHFLYHRSLRGFGSRPVTLYENVERWRTAAGQSTEQP